jgi:hypothetical protein
MAYKQAGNSSSIGSSTLPDPFTPKLEAHTNSQLQNERNKHSALLGLLDLDAVLSAGYATGSDGDVARSDGDSARNIPGMNGSVSSSISFNLSRVDSTESTVSRGSWNLLRNAQREASMISMPGVRGMSNAPNTHVRFPRALAHVRHMACDPAGTSKPQHHAWGVESVTLGFPRQGIYDSAAEDCLVRSRGSNTGHTNTCKDDVLVVQPDRRGSSCGDTHDKHEDGDLWNKDMCVVLPPDSDRKRAAGSAMDGNKNIRANHNDHIALASTQLNTCIAQGTPSIESLGGAPPRWHRRHSTGGFPQLQPEHRGNLAVVPEEIRTDSGMTSLLAQEDRSNSTFQELEQVASNSYMSRRSRVYGADKLRRHSAGDLISAVNTQRKMAWTDACKSATTDAQSAHVHVPTHGLKRLLSSVGEGSEEDVFALVRRECAISDTQQGPNCTHHQGSDPDKDSCPLRSDGDKRGNAGTGYPAKNSRTDACRDGTESMPRASTPVQARTQACMQRGAGCNDDIQIDIEHAMSNKNTSLSAANDGAGSPTRMRTLREERQIAASPNHAFEDHSMLKATTAKTANIYIDPPRGSSHRTSTEHGSDFRCLDSGTSASGIIHGSSVQPGRRTLVNSGEVHSRKRNASEYMRTCNVGDVFEVRWFLCMSIRCMY